MTWHERILTLLAGCLLMAASVGCARRGWTLASIACAYAGGVWMNDARRRDAKP